MLVSEIEAEEDEWTEVVITPWQHICPYLDNFEKWLLSADGKSKPSRQAKQHRRLVEEVVLKNVSDRSFDIAALFNRQELRQKWLNSFEKSRKAHTVKTYIYSLWFFLQIFSLRSAC